MTGFHRKTKIIATLGPATNTKEAIERLKSKGIDFVRINMSHSSTKDLRRFIALAQEVGVPFIVDTEGSQIRTGRLKAAPLNFKEGDTIKLLKKEVSGDQTQISIRPPEILSQLEEGDLIYCDFHSLVLRIVDTAKVAGKNGYVTTKVVAAGSLGSNKGAIVQSIWPHKQYNLPPLSPKDYQSIKIGLKAKVGYIAASFMRSGAFVDEVRRATKGKMKIISKIECLDGLNQLDDIIQKSDYLLIDRGDLSKEIAIEQVPLVSKIIITKANKAGRGVYVATNLLETMINQPKPTRAEIHDVEQIILDGAYGLVLAAETAVGQYPFLCANTLVRTIDHVESYLSTSGQTKAAASRAPGYLRAVIAEDLPDSLILPHGGTLVNRLIEKPEKKVLTALPRLLVSD